MHPYRPLFELAPVRPRPRSRARREVTIAFAALAGVSAVQLATAWRAHGPGAAQTLAGVAFLIAGVGGAARSWRSR